MNTGERLVSLLSRAQSVRDGGGCYGGDWGRDLMLGRLLRASAGLARRLYRAQLVEAHGWHSDDRRVPLDAISARDGYVYVGSLRALGPHRSTGILPRQTVTGGCSAHGSFTASVRLWVRWEPALGRPMFHYRPEHLCPLCDPRSRSPKASGGWR